MTNLHHLDQATQSDTTARATSLSATAAWVLIVQCLLAISWTIYLLFLPGMLAAAGIEKRWVVYVLIVDQVVFAACDWIAGVFADRVATVWRRTGRVISAVTLLSSAALLVMPWIATGGNAPLLFAIIIVWAATSSALRAPVFALLGRVRESDTDSKLNARKAGMVSIALVGIALASAIGPYVTQLLKGLDPRLPIAVSALSLALAGLWALRAEKALPPPSSTLVDAIDAIDAATRRRRVWSLAAVVLIAGIGTQLVTAILAPPLLQHFVGADAVIWAAWFWIGFAAGLIPGARAAALEAASGKPLLAAAVALIVACIAMKIGATSDTLALLIVGLIVTGAAWGVFTTVAFSTAVSLSGGRATVRGAGTASGMLFSALAMATVIRLICVATGVSRSTLIAWAPQIAWLLASGLIAVVVQKVWRGVR